jgi:hypothetical protein
VIAVSSLVASDGSHGRGIGPIGPRSPARKLGTEASTVGWRHAQSRPTTVITATAFMNPSINA